MPISARRARRARRALRPAAAHRLAAVVVAVGVLAGCGSTGPSTSSEPVPSTRPTGGAASPSSFPTVRPQSAAPAPSVDPSPTIDATRIDLRPVADGLVAPVGLVASPTIAGRSFVLEQDGRILILDGDTLRSRPFLDVSSSL